MKKLLILILTFSLCLLSCDRKKSEKTQSDFKSKTEFKVEQKSEPKKMDTTVVYWQTDFDTIRTNQELKIGNEIHKLELKTYSLNDSSIVRINDINKPIIYKDIYHDQITEIILKKDNDIILKSKVSKLTFKDSLLDGDFLKYSVWLFRSDGATCFGQTVPL
ncbi:hypothetical protein A9996_18630 [Gelidibacter algens]|uniref:hypothetical protein n=1 Tax=Gelidibacter algens TaxID=49280 RepID=UPI000805E393|nr:hypothetical protein [Gelidibacter algens]OBX21013.1 hypothetical protein A9996_18630 [Gelidibacter algens]